MTYTTPLSVYIVSHPDYADGKHIADFLYTLLCRDINNPLVRTIGIPVYFRNTNESSNNKPIKIEFDESEFTAVIALVSDEFVCDTDYAEYLDKIHEQCMLDPSCRRVYPIAISKSAFNVSQKMSHVNFIRLEKQSFCSNDTKLQLSICDQIKIPILHELCRLLKNMIKATDETDSLVNSPPVKLFISHSKRDSLHEATQFRDYINSQTQLKTFFDATDIGFGTNFGEEIKKSVKESALVVFQSDSYSEREWCRTEVLEAKKYGCPLVIVNAIQNGEKRAFPYLGNYPSIRYKNNFLDIIALTLEQVLFNIYSEMNLKSLASMYGILNHEILTTPPELFNFFQLKKQSQNKADKRLVIYPDPPLGTEEMEILNQVDDNFIFITPLTLYTLTTLI